jgi:hypothetical protein
MADRRGKNEGFRLLEEFVCQAIPDSSLQGSGMELGTPGCGINQGARVLQEAVLVAGSPETQEAARQRKESLPRLLICAIFHARALELQKRLPVNLGELDLGEQGTEATVRIVSRYLMAREMDFLRPIEVRNSFLIDLAILMTELARPHSIFLAEAKKTAIDVASRLLRFEGWSSAPSALFEWKEQTLAIDPARPNAAKEYLALLRRYWGWVGPPTATGIDDEEVARALSIPEAILTGLTRRCS